jgi:hypothetical protein
VGHEQSAIKNPPRHRTVSCDPLLPYELGLEADIRVLREMFYGRLGPQTYGLDFKTEYPFLKASLENSTNAPVLFTPLSVEKWIDILTVGKNPNGFLEESRKGLNIPRISGWLLNCLKNHKHGISKTARVFNMRLIDVETNMVVLVPEASEYVALSYIWGWGGGAVGLRCR